MWNITAITNATTTTALLKVMCSTISFLDVGALTEQANFMLEHNNCLYTIA